MISGKGTPPPFIPPHIGLPQGEHFHRALICVCQIFERQKFMNISSWNQCTARVVHFGVYFDQISHSANIVKMILLENKNPFYPLLHGHILTGEVLNCYHTLHYHGFTNDLSKTGILYIYCNPAQM